MQNESQENAHESFKNELRQKLGLLGHYTFLLKQRVVGSHLACARLDNNITENEAKELLERRTGRTTELLLEALCQSQIRRYNVVITTSNKYKKHMVMEKLCEFINVLNEKASTLVWSTRNENQVRNETTGRMIVVVVLDNDNRGLAPVIILHDI